MKRLSSNAFGDLIEASAKTGDEFDVQVEQVKSPVVKKALEAQKARDAEAIQNQILSALDLSRRLRDTKVREIRTLRKQVDKLLSDLKKLEAVEKTATDTGDFRPLLVAVGQRVQGFKGESLTDLSPTCDYGD